MQKNIELNISIEDRDLILNETFIPFDLEDRLKLAPLEGSKIKVKYSREEIDELLGFIAAEANHVKSRKLEKALDELYDYIESCLEGD